MFYHLLVPLQDVFSGFNVFRYITFRSIGAIVTAFLIVTCLGPKFIRLMQKHQVGQVIRDDGPETHFSKQGVPTMGGLLILFAVTVSSLLWVNLTNQYIWIILGVTLWFGVIGGIDDYRKIKKKNSKGLSGRGKLFLQTIGVLAGSWFLLRHSQFDTHLSFPFFKDIQPDLGGFYILFAIFVIVGCSNAVNLTDGLDGLAIGPTVVTSGVYLLFSYLAGHVGLAAYLQIPYVPGAGEMARKVRLLVVDDEAEIRHLLLDLLSSSGWRVDVANMLGRQGATQVGHKISRGIRKAVKKTAPRARPAR